MKWMETWDIISAGLDLSNTFDNETPIPTENSYRAVFLSFDIVCRLFFKKVYLSQSVFSAEIWEMTLKSLHSWCGSRWTVLSSSSIEQLYGQLLPQTQNMQKKPPLSLQLGIWPAKENVHNYWQIWKLTGILAQWLPCRMAKSLMMKLDILNIISIQ